MKSRKGLYVFSDDVFTYFFQHVGILTLICCLIICSYDRSIFRISEHFIRVAFPFAESPNENDTLRRKNDTLNASGDTLNDTLDSGDDTLKTDGATLEDRIISILAQFPDMTYENLAESLSVGRATIARTMKKMIGDGLVERSGSKKTGEWKILK